MTTATVPDRRQSGRTRRSLLLAFLLSLPVLLILALLAAEENRPQAWQAELDRYIVYRQAVVSDTLKTKVVDEGTRPWHFDAIMSRATFGENPFFQTDYGYDGKSLEGAPASLPYPPQSLWCALVTSTGQDASAPHSGATYSVVIIAEHHDLHNVAMVVHEVADAHIPLAESLAMVGCTKVMEEVRFEEAGVWT